LVCAPCLRRRARGGRGRGCDRDSIRVRLRDDARWGMKCGPHLAPVAATGESGVGWRRLLGRLGRAGCSARELAKKKRGAVEDFWLLGCAGEAGPEEGR
jgi:hypothetical protein